MKYIVSLKNINHQFLTYISYLPDLGFLTVANGQGVDISQVFVITTSANSIDGLCSGNYTFTITPYSRQDLIVSDIDEQVQVIDSEENEEMVLEFAQISKTRCRIMTKDGKAWAVKGDYGITIINSSDRLNKSTNAWEIEIVSKNSIFQPNNNKRKRDTIEFVISDDEQVVIDSEEEIPRRRKRRNEEVEVPVSIEEEDPFTQRKRRRKNVIKSDDDDDNNDDQDQTQRNIQEEEPFVRRRKRRNILLAEDDQVDNQVDASNRDNESKEEEKGNSESESRPITNVRNLRQELKRINKDLENEEKFVFFYEWKTKVLPKVNEQEQLLAKVRFRRVLEKKRDDLKKRIEGL